MVLRTVLALRSAAARHTSPCDEDKSPIKFGVSGVLLPAHRMQGGVQRRHAANRAVLPVRVWLWQSSLRPSCAVKATVLRCSDRRSAFGAA